MIESRHYHLGIANHLDKWMVFWLFTAITVLIPYGLEMQSRAAFKKEMAKPIELPSGKTGTSS